jgi:signal transduction histidine kinase
MQTGPDLTRRAETGDGEIIRLDTARGRTGHAGPRGLEVERSTAHSVRADVLDLIRDAAEVLGFEPRLSCAGPIDTALSPMVGTELLATLKEALSNVIRHSRARRVYVDVDVDDLASLIVVDDGVGLPRHTAHHGNGLRSMRERAERLGGAFDIGGRPDGGTTMSWHVPLKGLAPTVRSTDENR